MTVQHVISSVSANDRTAPRVANGGFSRPSLGSMGAVFVVGLWLFPVYWIVLTSLSRSGRSTTAVPSFIFTPTGANYLELFTKFDFARVLMNSLVITMVSCFVVIVLALLAAYALGRMKVPAKSISRCGSCRCGFCRR